MENAKNIINVVSYVGAWLLFVGPVIQARMELAEEARRLKEGFDASENKKKRDELIKSMHDRGKKREQRRHTRAEMLSILSPEQLEVLRRFGRKALAWEFVGIGAACLAVKETFELCEGFEMGLVWFFVIVVLTFAACLYFGFKRKR
ncbi:MAG: hypothetical protein LBM97_02410 [Candidatus Nomurabacteria bacterium]|jgi:hypothetical protein|nr:hypothetical protein [Candidatus Nomurabacteria bacterium]